MLAPMPARALVAVRWHASMNLLVNWPKLTPRSNSNSDASDRVDDARQSLTPSTPAMTVAACSSSAEGKMMCSWKSAFSCPSSLDPPGSNVSTTCVFFLGGGKGVTSEKISWAIPTVVLFSFSFSLIGHGYLPSPPFFATGPLLRCPFCVRLTR